MKLRGAFNPLVQLLLGLLSISILITSAIWLWRTTRGPDAFSWMVLDLRMMPIAFVLGLVAGSKIGELRLQGLQAALPEVDGKLFLSQERTLSKFREGENAIKLQRLGFALAFLTWFALTTFTGGKVLLYGSTMAYGVGQYLTGQTLPFIFIGSENSRTKRDA